MSRKKPQPQQPKQSPKPEPKPTAKDVNVTHSKVGKRYFAKNYFIRGHGLVKQGDECTAELMKIWNGIGDPQTKE